MSTLRKHESVWHLGKLGLFKDLDHSEIQELDEMFEMEMYARHQVILDPTNCCKVYIVKSGRVEIYTLSADGKKVIIDVLEPGSIFADFGGAFASGVFVEALEESYVCSVDKEEFFTKVSKHPVLAERLMRHLFNRLLRMEYKASSLAADSVLNRFLKLLVSLGKPTENSNEHVTDAYTHEQLAQMIGVSRQTLTSLINQLEKQQLIRRDKKRFRFNHNQLLRLSE